MQQKKYAQNPEIPAFNIRKVNKKTLGTNKNQYDFQYYTPEMDCDKKNEIYTSSSTYLIMKIQKKKKK